MGWNYRKRSNSYRAYRPSFRNPGVPTPLGIQGPQIFLGPSGPYVLVLIHGILYQVPIKLVHHGPNPTNPGLVHNKPPRLDPHEVLGVPKSATLDEISRAYRSKAKEHHPDKVDHMAPEIRALAEQKMKEINEAYNLLKGKG